MNEDLRQVVQQLVELTGAEAPRLLSADAASPDARDLARRAREGFYLVGIIGGKEVGKSALINALVGQPITRSTSWGEGTGRAIAYAHQAQASAVRALLEREVPGRYELITHEVEDLRSGVLLDLPDIDSHWKEHVQITRRMLRHMLYPVWMQSVEKYADVRAQALLREVAAGNAPENFIFVLNKIDQVGSPQSPQVQAEVEELRQDYAMRIGRVLELDDPPRVFAISALQPRAFDLPELRRCLLQVRSQQTVMRAIELADRRQAATVLQWVRERQLPQLADRADRLVEQADELVQARLVPVVTERAMIPLVEDPARRLELADASLSQRVRAWPLVNILHATLWPVLALIRANVARSAPAADDSTALEPVIQGVFGQLYQAQPIIGSLYARQRLWEPMAASQAAGRLQEALGRSTRAHHQRLAGRAGRTSMLLAPVRWLLTIGALIWFPLAQPLLAALLPGESWPGVGAIALLLVNVISVGFLLQSAAFLLLWYGGLWLLLRWHTQRRVERALAVRSPRDEADPAAVVADWLDDLLAPLHAYRQRLHELLDRVQQLESRAA